MKRKRHVKKRERPEAPRIEPSSRQLEAELFQVAFPERSWLRMHPF